MHTIQQYIIKTPREKKNSYHVPMLKGSPSSTMSITQDNGNDDEPYSPIQPTWQSLWTRASKPHLQNQRRLTNITQVMMYLFLSSTFLQDILTMLAPLSAYLVKMYYFGTSTS